MNVYKVYCDTDLYRVVFADNPKDLDELVFHPQGKPFGANWSTPSFHEANPSREGYHARSPADFVGIHGSAIGLTQSAFGKSAHLFRPYGELLPIDVRESNEHVWWFHCTNVVDALDEARASVWRSPSTDRIADITEYVFLSDRLRGDPLFQLPYGKSTLFCTEPFKRKIEALGLTGLSFWLVWSDEPEGIEILKRRRAERARPPTPSVH